MLSIRNTENLTGVTICGDYHDLERLVDAFHILTIDEDSEKYQGLIRMSTRVLGVCYDVRHAYQGDREIELADNGMTAEKMKYHGIIVPQNNVYYKCNCLYPEMFYIMLALNTLVRVRIRELIKEKYAINEAYHKDAIWDDIVPIIRTFQAEFVKCVHEVLTGNTFSRWKNLMSRDPDVEHMAFQYLDYLNVKYIAMTREKRLKSIVSITKRMVEYRFDQEYAEIKEAVVAGTREFGCSEQEIRLDGIDYPDEIEW